MPAARFRLFEDLAHRYDLHTPAHHYGNDHAFVLDNFRGSGRRILDVGCGTGVLVQKALAEGFDAHGIDIAEGMVREAVTKVGAERVSIGAMEEVADESTYDGLCALSWVINYAADTRAARDILARFRRALRPGGKLLLHTAHAPNMDGKVLEDRELSPAGAREDIVFLFQFTATGADTALARYVYAAKSLGELAWEEHPLAVADAHLLARLCSEVGFADVRVYGSWHRDGLGSSISPWVVAEVPCGE
jgi:SAM-dependent methyltransferase